MAKIKKENKQQKEKMSKKKSEKVKEKMEEKESAVMDYITQDVPEEQSFILKDGSKVNNLVELAKKFDAMEDDVYSHHVTEDRNDFANWIKDVMGKEKLAENVSKAGHKDKTQIELLKHIIKEKKKWGG